MKVVSFLGGTALLVAGAEVALGAAAPYPFGWRVVALAATVGHGLNYGGIAGFSLVVAAVLLAVSSAG